MDGGPGLQTLQEDPSSTSSHMEFCSEVLIQSSEVSSPPADPVLFPHWIRFGQVIRPDRRGSEMEPVGLQLNLSGQQRRPLLVPGSF